MEIIAIPLTNTKARVAEDPIFNQFGDPEEDSAWRATHMELYGSRLFLKGEDMYVVLIDTWWKTKDGIVSIVIPGLREIYYYYRNRPQFISRKQEIEDVMHGMSFKFKDIYCYEKLRGYQGVKNLSEFQLKGLITPLDIVHVSARFFVGSIQANMPIQIALSENGPLISLTYRLGDFFSTEKQTSRFQRIRDVFPMEE